MAIHELLTNDSGLLPANDLKSFIDKSHLDITESHYNSYRQDPDLYTKL